MQKVFLAFLAPTLALSMFLTSPPVSGQKWKDNDHPGRHGHQGKKWDKDKNGKNYRRGNSPGPSYFDDRHRAIAHNYYAPRFERGHCPPGLAKKYSGCMPPGQAKKWRIGYALPRDVIFYDLPHVLLQQLGVPGPGYRYVRVAADILLIAVGTGMVIDAIQDLNAM
jgi:Ni/Co efflux regulator RcnB